MQIFNLPPTESRGAPDGCGLDPAVEALTKKGWLMKQGATKEWHKYWFVLQDVALLFYRDPKAETKGFLDGIIDLSQVQRIGKQDLPRHFGFYVRTYDGKVTLFSGLATNSSFFLLPFSEKSALALRILLFFVPPAQAFCLGDFLESK